MNYLFSTISDVKKFVTSFSNSFEIEDLQSNLYESAEKYIIPVIGFDLWEKVLQDFNNDTLSGDHSLLLPFIQRPLLHFALYHQVPESAVEWQNSGFTQRTGENYKVADFRDVIKLQKSFELKAWDNLERLIIYLEAKENLYPLYWDNDDVRSINKANFINTAFEFNKSYNIIGGRLTFEGIRALITDIEELMIMPEIGESYFNLLKAEVKAKNIDARNIKPIELLQKAIAHQTIHEAIAQKIVRMKGKTLVLNHEFKGYDTKKAATPLLAQSKKYQAYDFAARYISKLTTILQKDPALYPEYQAHKVENENNEFEESNKFDNEGKSIFVI